MDDLKETFAMVSFFLIIIGFIIWCIFVISTTPVQCWFSKAPITCGRTIEIQEQLERK